MLTNGRVNLTKAKAQWGDLSAASGCCTTCTLPAAGQRDHGGAHQRLALKILPLIGGEATHGLQMDDHTIFPSPISLAATWDVGLMKRYGQTVGSEARVWARNITWSPVLGLCREPRWGRCER